MNIASASQSRPGLTSRAPTLSSTCSNTRRQKFPTSRNFVVFPVQLGQPKSPLEAFPFTSYTTIDLKARHSYDPNLAQEVGKIWVDTASYYKQKQSPQHEFIIFSVTTSDGMQNFIALDRNVQVPGSSGLIPRSNKNGPPAQDYFHVSHYADMESLINHCGHATSEDLCSHVEQVAFEPQAFSFAQLVVLASAISESCPSYQLNATNCYWFASLIWECMFDVFRGGVLRHKKLSEERGRFRGLKIQGKHENFQQVVQKYKNDFFEFTRGLGDDATSVLEHRSRKMSTLTYNRPEMERVHAGNTLAPPTESSRSRTVSTAGAPRPQATRKEQDPRAERTRATSLCPTSRPQDPAGRLSASINKELPSLPSGALARSRTVSRDDRRGSRLIPPEVDFLSAPLPDSITKASNRYSDIGKNFEQATAAHNQASSRPASSYVTPAPKQVQFESNGSRIPDSSRLKANSLPARSSSPGNESAKDRVRSPSLPAGSTPPEIREPITDARNSTAESSNGSAPRTRTTSGLGKLRRALPRLLLPTVSESDDVICESPELSSWTEIESAEYDEGHPFADGASERLSFIEFPQPPGPPGLSAVPTSRGTPAASGVPAVRVAQGHRVHPRRVEYADGSRKRRSTSPAASDRDSKYSVTRS
ncbi:unnamed protein product [Rhizoctonia solani]|uniref:Uncharacterized protein n=1 Tax=Rhizoctonia solani TaxID=456999 RepID=A0A8H3AHG0_9AGAM|nr:unnamed protein product [Rhizoctonia solani]